MKLVRFSSIGMITLAGLDSIYERIFQAEVTHEHLLYISYMMITILSLGVILGRKTLFVNQIGKDLVKTFMMGILFIFANRMIGMLYDITPNFILSVDILILGTSFGNIPILRSRYSILLSCLFFASLSILFKDNSYLVLDLFLLSSIVAWLTILFDWKNQEEEQETFF